MISKSSNPVLPIVLATAWIGFSEFVRNEVILKSVWEDHYRSLGIIFPSEEINGAIWGLWSALLAVLIYWLLQKFSLKQTTFIAWWSAFFMMWVVIGNMNVLPVSILWLAVPLSLLEVYIAAVIINRFKTVTKPK